MMAWLLTNVVEVPGRHALTVVYYRLKADMQLHCCILTSRWHAPMMPEEEHYLQQARPGNSLAAGKAW